MPKQGIVRNWHTVRASYDGRGWTTFAKGDKPGPGVAPNYVTGATVGQWSTIPSSVANTSPAWQGDIFSAWTGGIVNTVGLYDGATFIAGTFLVYVGGGHTNDFNEVLAFGPLESDDTAVRKWRRLRDRTVPSIIKADQDGNGNPVAGHSYDQLQFDPVTNRMFRIGISYRYDDGNSVLSVWVFDFNLPNPNSAQPWSKRSVTLTAPAYTSIFEPSQRLIYFRPQARNEVATYDIDNDVFDVLSGKTPNPGDDTGDSAYDETRGLWITLGNGAAFYRTNNGVLNDYDPISTTGTGPTMGAGTYGAILRDPVDDRFVAWMSGNKTLHFLTPPSSNPYTGGNPWTWSSFTPPSGSTPSAPQTFGTFSRFALVKFATGERIYVAMNQPAANIDFYRAA